MSEAPSYKLRMGILFATVFINLVGFGIVIPVLPLYAEMFGASPVVIGLLLATFSIFQMFFAPILGKLSDRFGRRPILLLSILGTGIGFWLMGAAETLWLLFIARSIDGITGGNISVAQAYIADITTPEQRSKGMGLIGAAFGLGFIFGPALGGVLSQISMSAPFYFAAGLSAINAIWIYFALPESLQEKGASSERVSFWSALTSDAGPALRLAFGVSFLMTVSFSILTATYALFTEHRFGFLAMENGVIFAAQGVLGAIVQGGLIGLLVKRFGDKRLVFLGCASLALGFWLLPMSDVARMLFVATAFVALGHSLLSAPLNGMVSKSVSAQMQGSVLGWMQSVASMARIIGPILGGWLLHLDFLRYPHHLGKQTYGVASILMLLACVLVLCLRSPRRA